MKIKITVLLVFFSLNTIFSQQQVGNTITYEHPYFGSLVTFEINNDLIKYTNTVGLGFKGFDFPNEIFIENYTKEYIHGVPFLVSEDGNPELLALFSEEICILYISESINESGSKIFTGFNNKLPQQYNTANWFTTPTASSELVEGSIVYEAKNLIYGKLKLPWVEGVNGQGINESISLSLKHFSGDKEVIKGFYIINGYLSFDHPERYEYNSRIKSFRIRTLDNSMIEEFEILDTPDPQFIYAPDFTDKDIIIELLDVYPGTKYQDTCIAQIILRQEDNGKDYH